MDSKYNFMGIKMDYINGNYVITRNGEVVEYTTAEHQKKNPVLATNKFASEVSAAIKGNLRKYLIEQGHNHVMGCKVTGCSCQDCKLIGTNTAENGCIFGAVHNGEN